MNANITAAAITLDADALTLDFAPLEAGVNSVLAGLGDGPKVFVPLDEIGDDLFAGIAAYIRSATAGIAATA